MDYECFCPDPINRKWEVDDMELLQMLGEANREIGRLDMFAEYIPNPDLFVRMHVVKEATQSSKIEGTQTSIDEALLHKVEVREEQRDDWEEVQNYVNAMNEAIDSLSKLPISTRLIKQAHYTLLQGVRGQYKLPGDFRSSQNWIGGASLRDAAFVPPHHSMVHDLMSDLEKFVHNGEYPFPELLKAAIVHYQFETIHPFLDGNGRVGRLMISLYMVEKGLLNKPVLYLSDFFARHRQVYYDKLMHARLKQDITPWLKFFLVGVIETAKKSSQTLDYILKLQRRMDQLMADLGGIYAQHGPNILQALYQNPMMDYEKLQEITGLSISSNYRILKKFEELNILELYSEGRRNRKFVFGEYLRLFMDE